MKAKDENREKIKKILNEIDELFEFYYYDNNGNVVCQRKYHLEHIQLFNKLSKLLGRNKQVKGVGERE